MAKDITTFFKIDVPEENDKTLIAFCDGSSIDNGKPNCRCGFAVVWPYHPDFDSSVKIREGQKTNNRAEYSALYHTMVLADTIDPEGGKTLIVYTDSMLLINSLTKWIEGWKKNHWKKADGYPVLNQDLLKLLDEKRKKRNLVLRHVRAHTGKDTWEAKWNDKVDRMARAAALGK